MNSHCLPPVHPLYNVVNGGGPAKYDVGSISWGGEASSTASAER